MNDSSIYPETRRETAGFPDVVDLVAADGTPLRGHFWQGRNARGTLVIAHGLGEHSGCYDDVARELTHTPGLVDVLCFDFRGHGVSAGRRGVVRHYDELLLDLRAALDWTGQARPDRPVFLLGHSNGGQVVLQAAIQGDPRIAGLVVSNPSLELAVAVPQWKLMTGKILRCLAPGVTLSADLPQESLTRDSDRWPERLADPLRHSRVSAPLFFGMIEGGAQVLSRAEKIHQPALVLLGEADPIVKSSSTRAFFDRLGSPDKTLHLYPEMLHEPLNELGRERVRADLTDWLRRHLDNANP